MRPAVWFALMLLVVTIAAFASLAIGTRSIAIQDVIGAIIAPEAGDADHVVVRDLRLPRLVIGLLAGCALGVVGATMQGVTRNPLADPGLFGINSGASLAVVAAIALFGISTPTGFIWFAFGGAAAAAIIVFAIGGTGRDGATPVKLALTGAALTAAIQPLITLVLIGDLETLGQFRFWSVGSLAGRDLSVAAALWPFVLAGLVLAGFLGRRLNLLALGDDVARGLGVRLTTTRTLAAVIIVVLSGTATALAGPIVLLGLAVPHIARRMIGPDYRWILALSGLIGAAILLLADVVGRVVAAPAELEAGIVVAFIGAPVLIATVRRARLAGL
jgi:iron complex transport system permease protein